MIRQTLVAPAGKRRSFRLEQNVTGPSFRQRDLAMCEPTAAGIGHAARRTLAHEAVEQRGALGRRRRPTRKLGRTAAGIRR